VRIVAGGVALALAGCAAAPPEAPVAPLVALRNAGFEAPARPGERCPIEWSCSMHADPDAFRFVRDTAAPAEGTASLCIERVTREPWAVASQSVQAAALRGRKARLIMRMRGEGLTGPGAGPFLLVHGPVGVLLHDERVALLGPKWERRTLEFTIPEQAMSIDVGATLLGGGRACIDDVRLEPA